MYVTRNRSWCFTINNYSESEWELVNGGLDGVIVYLVASQEIAPTTGTPHIQGYVRFPSAKSLANCKVLFGDRASFRVAKGTADQNRIYVFKLGKGQTANEVVCERGKRPPGPGKRTDLTHVLDAVKDGDGMEDIISETPTYAAYNFAKAILPIFEPERDGSTETVVIWLWGSTGTGKTRLARELYPKAYFKGAGGLKWWEGYDGHEFVIIDDFRPESLQFVGGGFAYLLALTDRYPCKVEFKGGSRQFRGRVIIITAPIDHKKMFLGELNENVDQLSRRIMVEEEIKK